jgi:hypothetical protein
VLRRLRIGEGIATHTFYKWKEKIAHGDFYDSHRTEIELRQRIREPEGAVSLPQLY